MRVRRIPNVILCALLIIAIIASQNIISANTFGVEISSSDETMGIVGKTENAGSVTISAAPYPDYRFVGWYDGDTLVNTSDSYSFTPLGNISYKARFAFRETYLVGDTTGDESVNVIDMVRMKKYLAHAAPVISFCSSDINQDSNVSAGDLVMLKTSLLTSETSTVRTIDEIISAALKLHQITAEQTSFFDIKYSPNLLNLDTLIAGKFVNPGGGLSSNTSYTTSDYIPCSPGDTIRHQFNYITTRYDNEDKPTYTNFSRVAAYDSNKNFIPGSYASYVPVYKAPQDAAYIRISYTSWNKGQFSDSAIIISHSSEVIPFSKFGASYTIKQDYLPVEEINAFLPSEICVAVGRTIEIYNAQVSPSASKYHFRWNSYIGCAMERKFTVTGFDGNVGKHRLTLDIVDDSLKVIWSGETTLNIAPGVSKAMSLVTIGDSLTNDKVWESELINLNSNISLVGTRTNVLPDCDGTPRQVYHEGRSGWTAAKYLTAGDSTENPAQFKYINPFWNPANKRFDWNYYVTNKLGGKSPDAVQIFLGTNGIALDPTENAANIKAIADYIRADDADIPIYVVNTLYRANQNAIGGQTASDGYTQRSPGMYKYEEDMKVFNLMVRLNSLFAGYSNLYFVPLALCHDSEYNYGSKVVKVNPRAEQTETVPIESVHPQAQGYYQMADIMYSAFSAHQ